MAEINKKILEAKAQLEASLNDNTEIVEHTDADEMKEIVSEIGQRNNTAIQQDEIVEFLSMDEYNKDIKNNIIHTRSTSSNGNTFDNLYALVLRYFVVGGKHVGERMGFINVGGMVRRHFDLGGLTPNAEGKVIGAQRVVTPGDFNTKLASYRMPWAMLEGFLAGKKVTAKRSSDKLFFQRFENRRPVADEYVEQQYLIYNFVK